MTSGSSQPLSERLGRLLLVIAAAATALSVGLGLGWWRSAHAPGVRIEELSRTDRARLATRLLAASPGIFAPAVFDPAIGYTLKPGRKLTAWEQTFVSNDLGYRSGPTRKRPGVVRVVFVGDSWAFGQGERFEDTFPAQVAELATSHAASPHPIEAWSLALPGYNALNEVAALETFVDLLEPDAVVFCPTINDADSTRLVLPNGSLGITGFAGDGYSATVEATYGGQAVESFLFRARFRQAFDAIRRVEIDLERRNVPLLIFFTALWPDPFANDLVAAAGIDAPYVITPYQLVQSPFMNAWLHPNAAAHARYARIVYDALAPLVGWRPIPEPQPEQARSDLVDARADLYALGCVLYELLALSPPCWDSDPARTLWLHANVAPRPLSQRVVGVPPDLDAVVSGLLSKDPATRLGHADTVAAALIDLGAVPWDRPLPEATPHLYRPTMIGRNATLDALRFKLDGLQREEGGLVAIGGESGAGKTRLVTEAAAHAARANIRVVASVSNVARRAPLFTLRPLLTHMADRCRTEGPETGARILGPRLAVLSPYEPALARLAPPSPEAPPAELPPDEARVRLFVSLLDSLVAMAGSDPYLLILDDLQWADELSLSFLSFALASERLSRGPLLLVATYRTEEVTPQLGELLAQPSLTSITLDRLDLAAVAGLVSDMLGIRPAPARLTEFLAEQTQGNPLYVAEYLRAAVDAGLLRRDDRGRWVTSSDDPSLDLARLGLPESLRKLLRTRLEALSADAREVVHVTAALGRGISSELLARAVPLSDDNRETAIAELLRGQILEERDGGLHVHHDKIREVAHDEMGAQERQEVHRRLAAILEDAEAAAGLEEIGIHWEQGGEAGRAADYYLRAAREAAAGYAQDDAIRLYRAYLSTARATPAVRGAVMLELAPLLREQGAFAESLEHARRAIAIATSEDDRRLLAAALSNEVATLLVTGDNTDAARQSSRAISVCRLIDDPGLLANTLSQHAQALEHQGRTDEALAGYAESASVLDATDDALRQAILALNRGGLLRKTGRYAAAQLSFERALSFARSGLVPRIETRALGNLANIYFDRGEPARARAFYVVAHEIAVEIGDRRGEAIGLLNIANTFLIQRRPVEAEERYGRCLTILEGIGELPTRIHCLISMAELAVRHGKMSVGHERAEQALALARRCGDRWREVNALEKLAGVEAHCGDPARAESLYREAVEGYLGLQDPRGAGSTLDGLAHLVFKQGRTEEAVAIIEEALGRLPAEAAVARCEATCTRAEIERIAHGDLAAAEGWLTRARAITDDRAIPPTHALLLQEGLLALARGRSAAPQLEELRRMIGDCASDHDLASYVERLAEAQRLFEDGETLRYGDSEAHVPPRFRSSRS